MPKTTLPYFGEIDTESLESFYDVVVEIDGKELDLDLNFENTQIDNNNLLKIEQFLGRIQKLDKLNKNHIKEDYNDPDGEVIVDYIEHHLETFDKEDLTSIIDIENSETPPGTQLLNALHLVRVGLYPETNDQFAIFDYSIGKNLTPYIVTITLDSDGNLKYMDMES